MRAWMSNAGGPTRPRPSRATVSDAIVMGDGQGKPLGFLMPQAGLPICDTGVNTPPGEFRWQDLFAVKYKCGTSADAIPRRCLVPDEPKDVCARAHNERRHWPSVDRGEPDAGRRLHDRRQPRGDR